MKKLRHSDKIQVNTEFEAAFRRTASLSLDELLKQFKSSDHGLSETQVVKNKNVYGINDTSNQRVTSWITFLFHALIDEFIVVLLVLSFVSLILKDSLGAVIITVIALISVAIRFVQDYRAYLMSQKLKSLIHTMADVRRAGVVKSIVMNDLTLGDVVEIGNGSIIPADIILLEAKDLFVSQSMFTGESTPVEKKVENTEENQSLTSQDNLCLMGCNVISGSGTGIVIRIGKDTYLGHISNSVQDEEPKTNFEIGLDKITRVMIRYMSITVFAVFFINGLLKRDWLSAFMFSISVAVGITPSMLPLIINTTLSKGALFLSKKKTIVKNMSAIQNLGAIDVLCTDKTGTLTEDNIVFHQYMDINGVEDKQILNYIYLNSFFSTGLKNLIDSAVLDCAKDHEITEDPRQFKKIDEIPFDYQRRRMSVVIENQEGMHRLITKGAMEDILGICSDVRVNGEEVQLNHELRQSVIVRAEKLNREGHHVIAVAEKVVKIDVTTFCFSDEKDMVFIGFAAFVDPPKEGVKEAIEELVQAGIEVKVVSGDSSLVIEHVCRSVGIHVKQTTTGSQIEQMNDDELRKVVETTSIFARTTPIQKQRVVDALRHNGHVVGYLGDGVNDAPSLRHADVGISVDNAKDIAKESADIILMHKSLSVLKEGIVEGRRVYGNMMKYMKMALSSNFGNVFSVVFASLFLPFLPMIPIQILIQNLIYDVTQIAIPWDKVDSEFLEKPKQWDTKNLSRFMNVMGITSSVFDVLIFAILWFVLGYSTLSQQHFFQTGWFIEGLITQTLIVHFIRTSKISFFQSMADIRLILSTGLGIVLALIIPVLLYPVTTFNFAILPAQYYAYLVMTLIGYVFSVEVIKKLYIHFTGSWL